jgi:hypothetical protein
MKKSREKLKTLDVRLLTSVVGGSPEPAPWNPQPAPWNPEPAPWITAR